MVLAENVLTAKEGSATPDYASRLPCVFPEEALLANKVDETREGSGSKRRVSYARQMVAVFACVFPQIPVVVFANKILFYVRGRNCRQARVCDSITEQATKQCVGDEPHQIKYGRKKIDGCGLSVSFILNSSSNIMQVAVSAINKFCICMVFFTGHITCKLTRFFVHKYTCTTIYKYSYSASDKHNNNNLSYNHFHTQLDIINKTCLLFSKSLSGNGGGVCCRLLC